MSSIGRPGICGNLISGARYQFSTSSASFKSHYDTLGIHPKSTQNDIKSAYYELTKVYHPDKNKTDEAKGKFRDITTAYEILGNYKSRRMYDRGMRLGETYANTTDPVANKEEDGQTRFYRSRMTRSHVPAADGRTPIYNFDEWAKAHYGDLLNQNLRAKESWAQKQRHESEKSLQMDNSKSWFPLMTIFAVFITVMYTATIDRGLDIDKIGNRAKRAQASGNGSNSSKESSSASAD